MSRGLATLGAIGVMMCGVANAINAQPHCPTGELRAYSHNDYNTVHPLYDAVALGFRGVEVDVFLVDGILRVAHDQKAARKAPALDSAYLIPLRDVLARCNAASAFGTLGKAHFLLNIEIKQASQESYQAVFLALTKYRDLLATNDAPLTADTKIVVTLVGLSGLPGAQLADRFIGVSCKLEKIVQPPACLTDSRVTMVSLDYGKTLGRWWTLDTERTRWLALLRATKAKYPNKILRVYNVPVSRGVYNELFHAGVNLIGTKTLERSRVAMVGR